MAVHLTHFGLHKEALTETLEAAQILIDYQKQNSSKWTNSEGCLGYPALALLLTYINSFGNLFNGCEIGGKTIKGDTSTFLILNSKYFAQQNLSEKCLEDFYKSYRNKIIHNLSLPKDCFIEIKSSDNSWCATIGNSDNSTITTVFVKDLLNLCRLSFELIKDEHEQFFMNSKRTTIELSKKDKKTGNTNYGAHSSGVTSFDL